MQVRLSAPGWGFVATFRRVLLPIFVMCAFSLPASAQPKHKADKGVLKANASAIAFYLSLGFANEPGQEQMTAPGGTELCEIRLRKVLVG